MFFIIGSTVKGTGTICSRPCQNYFGSKLTVSIWWQLVVWIPLGWSDVSSSKDSVICKVLTESRPIITFMPFLPTSSALAKIATPSTVSIGQVRSQHRRFSVYISLCGSLCGYIFVVLSQISGKRKNVIINDCDTRHIFTNKLENCKLGWSVYVDDCDNIRTYYNYNISICWWLWKYSDLLQ